MKDGTPNDARSQPASPPHMVPRTSVRMIAPAIPRPHCVLPSATSTEEKATAGPTLMSISPAMITRVTPQAAIPIVAASRSSPS